SFFSVCCGRFMAWVASPYLGCLRLPPWPQRPPEQSPGGAGGGDDRHGEDQTGQRVRPAGEDRPEGEQGKEGQRRGQGGLPARQAIPAPARWPRCSPSNATAEHRVAPAIASQKRANSGRLMTPYGGSAACTFGPSVQINPCAPHNSPATAATGPTHQSSFLII